MKTSTFTILCALLASALTGAHARPQPRPTSAPLEQRSNVLSPRQADASAIVSSIRESPDAFMSSVTASDSTTAFSSATGFACKGLQRGNDGCCDTGVYINRKCWVVPGAPDGLSFYGNTDDYVPGEDDDDTSSSASASASSSASASQTSSASTSSSSSNASTASSQASQASSSAAAASSPSATSQSGGGSNDGDALQASLGLMAASFLGLVVAL